MMAEGKRNEPAERYPGEYRDIWCDQNHRQEFEHELINRKTTWSLTAQTLLFTAYGLALGIKDPEVGKKFRYVLAGSGLALAVLMFIGVGALIRSKQKSWKGYQEFYESFEENHLPRPLVRPLQWGVDTRNTWATLLPDLFLPIIFAMAWLIIIIIHA